MVERNGFRAGDVAIIDVENPSDDAEFNQDTRKAVRNWQDHRFQRIDGIVDLPSWDWIHAPSVKQVPDLHPG
jgi:hypothetical protein